MMEFSYLKSIENVINDCYKWKWGDGSFLRENTSLPPSYSLPHISESTHKWIVGLISYAFDGVVSSGNVFRMFSVCIIDLVIDEVPWYRQIHTEVTDDWDLRGEQKQIVLDVKSINLLICGALRQALYCFRHWQYLHNETKEIIYCFLLAI